MADSVETSADSCEGGDQKKNETRTSPTGTVTECLCDIFTALTQFSAEVNLGADVLQIVADQSKLQFSSATQPAQLYNSIQRHISKLQLVSKKLQRLMCKMSTESKIAAEGTAGKSEVNGRSASDISSGGSGNKEPEESKGHVDNSVVQIKAGKAEIDRRISAFIERKQAEINENNVREFCNVIDCNQENSCARTDAVFTPYPGFKSHVKVTRVVNTYGPQTRPGSTGDAADGPRRVLTDCGNPAVEERLQNIEAHLKLLPGGPVPLSIYQRLKRLEDRVLELEGLSPEYFQSLGYLHKRQKVSAPQPYSLMELDGKINALKATLLKKVNESLPMETDEFSL
ncbi:MAP3K12-binding inhibitory protein 1 [Lepisosteus oculatus]|uniref:MAP3K12-binding inhibitory protein 1 n=1 Tax=Lepisosteus oculatus TaxID=7918 RepID=UPI0003EAC2EA|nr:PREDICTED: MAP3K12-binding inhibitory protein 1 [Lepisosteus oculatus]